MTLSPRSSTEKNSQWFGLPGHTYRPIYSYLDPQSNHRPQITGNCTPGHPKNLFCREFVTHTTHRAKAIVIWTSRKPTEHKTQWYCPLLDPQKPIYIYLVPKGNLQVSNHGGLALHSPTKPYQQQFVPQGKLNWPSHIGLEPQAPHISPATMTYSLSPPIEPHPQWLGFPGHPQCTKKFRLHIFDHN